MTPDIEHKFELALILNRIDQAFEIAHWAPDSVEKFKWIGDISLKIGDFDLAEKCYEEANDLNSLYLILSCLGDE